ncbi:hypothetical protein ACMZOO_00945 [Catenovulum sp. SX2]|uniref:hypothetical protein n=1 Tax=Catenovulum sp. SX2 TaxID=3398614 RepID=UPI003F84470F
MLANFVPPFTAALYFNETMAKFLFYFNVLALLIFVALVGLQAKWFYHYIVEVNNPNRAEAIFGITMSAIMSLGLVAPASFAGYFESKVNPKLGFSVLLMCLFQFVVIAICGAI